MKMASRSINLISKKANCTCSTLFFSNQQKKKRICTCSTFFVFPCRCFAQLQRCFVGLNLNVKLPSYTFYGGIAVCAYPILCLLNSFLYFLYSFCLLYFSLPLIFTLLTASISYCLTAALNFHVLIFLQNSSLLFSITCSTRSSFSVIHVSATIKNNVKKDTTLLLFFLSKSPGGHAISIQIKPRVD